MGRLISLFLLLPDFLKELWCFPWCHQVHLGVNMFSLRKKLCHQVCLGVKCFLFCHQVRECWQAKEGRLWEEEQRCGEENVLRREKEKQADRRWNNKTEQQRRENILRREKENWSERWKEKEENRRWNHKREEADSHRQKVWMENVLEKPRWILV